MPTLEGWVQRTLAARGLTRAALLEGLPDASGLGEDDILVRLADRLGLEGGADEDPPWWPEAVRRKDEMSLKDLAEHLRVPVAQLTSELRRRGIRRRAHADGPAEHADSTAEHAYSTAEHAYSTAEHAYGVRERDDAPSDRGDRDRSASGDDSTSRPERRTGSKDMSVEQYFHLLGKVPDSEVARMAGVSVRTIASYRARNEVSGYAGPRRRPAPRGRRQSKVDDFTELLGRVPDRVVADVAGMSLGAVRNYRIKHDIPAAGRMTRDEIDRVVDDYRRGGASVGTSTPGWAPSEPRAPRADGGSRAWRCRLFGDSEGFIIVADSLRAAVDRALTAAGDESRIAGIEQLGTVLELD